MTLEEKIAILHAQSNLALLVYQGWVYRNFNGDGRMVYAEVLWDEWNQAGWTNDSCIAFPALTCLAATWNKEAALLYGRSIGEARYRKKMFLGPGINI